MIDPILILLVEDNPDHVFLTLEGLKRAGMENDVKVASDGEAALDYLYNRNGRQPQSKFRLPSLILLDIRLPKKDGLEVLKTIKEDEKLKEIPVVMLTTSQKEDEIIKSYDYGANSFITKPVELSGFMDAIKSLNRYWCVTSALPQAI